MNSNLKKISGLTYQDNELSNTNKIDSLPATVELNGYSYKITADANVENKKAIALAEGLTIGSVVTYEPIGSTYNWQAKYCSSTKTEGTDDVILDSTDEGNYRITSWKVFKIDEDIIQLVPNTLPSQTVYLGEAQGYNNGVKLLNDACSELYSYQQKGILARNINLKDIEPLLDNNKLQTAKNNSNHISKNVLDENDQAINPFTSSNYYPLIYEQEINNVINGNISTNGLDSSESPSYFFEKTSSTILSEGQTTSINAVNGYLKASTSIQPYHTYYDWSNALNTSSNYSDSTLASIYSNMLNKSFWVATRSLMVRTTGSACNYGLFVNNGTSFGVGSGFNSVNYNPGYHMNHIFPIIILNSEFIIKDNVGYRVQL